MPDRFLVVAGEEITDKFAKKQLHLTAFGSERLVIARHGETVAATIEADRLAIEEAGGVVILNQPNLHLGHRRREHRTSRKAFGLGGIQRKLVDRKFQDSRHAFARRAVGPGSDRRNADSGSRR
jgi:hypothetical protein